VSKLFTPISKYVMVKDISRRGIYDVHQGVIEETQRDVPGLWLQAGDLIWFTKALTVSEDVNVVHVDDIVGTNHACHS